MVPDQVELPRVHLAYRIPPFGTDAHEAFNVLSDLLGTGRASRPTGHSSATNSSRPTWPPSSSPGPRLHRTRHLGHRPARGRGRGFETQLLADIEQLAVEGPSDEELARVRTLHAAAVEAGLEQIGERADRISQYACLFDDPEMVNTEIARFDAVTATDVRAAMADRVGADNRVVLTYVPSGDETPDDEAGMSTPNPKRPPSGEPRPYPSRLHPRAAAQRTDGLVGPAAGPKSSASTSWSTAARPPNRKQRRASPTSRPRRS